MLSVMCSSPWVCLLVSLLEGLASRSGSWRRWLLDAAERQVRSERPFHGSSRLRAQRAHSHQNALTLLLNEQRSLMGHPLIDPRQKHALKIVNAQSELPH